MLPSLHSVPAGAAGFWQPRAGLHESVVHKLRSLQLRLPFDRQRPWIHDSTPLQTLKSVHELPSAIGALRQPRLGSHESFVHAFESLQFSTLQVEEQPSQFTGVPAVSHVSGNSTMPLPQVGQGTRHLMPGAGGAVHVSSAVTVAVGWTLAVTMVGATREGCWKVLLPLA